MHPRRENILATPMTTSTTTTTNDDDDDDDDDGSNTKLQPLLCCRMASLAYSYWNVQFKNTIPVCTTRTSVEGPVLFLVCRLSQSACDIY